MSANSLEIVGVDGFVFAHPESCPPAVFVYLINVLNQLLDSGFAGKYLFFIDSQSDAAVIRNFFCQQNIDFASVGSESSSNLDIYLIPDQVTVLPKRVPPLALSPRTVPISMIVHNLIALADTGNHLKNLGRELAHYYLSSLEMISASPAHLILPSELERSQAVNYLHVPVWQTSHISSFTAVPENYRPDLNRWVTLKERLKLTDRFAIVPWDTLSTEGRKIAGDFWSVLRSSGGRIQLIVPPMKDYISKRFPAQAIELIQDRNLIIVPQLDYSEFLELLFRCNAYFVPDQPLSSFGIAEARLLGTCICSAGQKVADSDVLITKSPADLEHLIINQPQKISSIIHSQPDLSRLLDVWNRLIESARP